MLKSLSSAGRGTIAAIAVVGAIVLFLCLNLITSISFGSARIDLTEDQLFTLSDSTRTVIDQVEEPVTLRFYVSSGLMSLEPQVRVYAERVSELLQTYERLSDGLISVERIDPIPFSTEEADAAAYSLVAVPLDRSGEQGYFGLVGTNSVDQLEVIEFLNPSQEQYLEYDITRMVLRLARATEPRIGLIDGLGMLGSQALGRQPSAMVGVIGDDYELVQVAVDATVIPEGLDALMIVHPHNLTETALYAIDQYVIRGGSVLAFVDPLAELSAPSPQNQRVPLDPASTLEPLFAAWGIELVPDRVVADRQLAQEVRVQTGQQQFTLTDYVVWLTFGDAQFQNDDVVTESLTVMPMFSVGAIRSLPGATTTLSPMISTTPDSQLLEQPVVMNRTTNAFDLLANFEPLGQPQIVAARITGPVSTAFPDGPPEQPAAEEGEDPPAPPPELITQSDGPVNIIVVADTDLLNNNLVVNPDTGRQSSSNPDFVINALDTLAGGGELVQLRSRGPSFRPFVRVDEIEDEARAVFQAAELQVTTELQQLNQRLSQLQLQAQNAQGGALGDLTAQSREEMADMNRRVIELQQQQREIQAAMRSEINQLTNQLQLLNIAAVPVIVILVGILVALWRRARLASYLRSRKASA